MGIQMGDLRNLNGKDVAQESTPGTQGDPDNWSRNRLLSVAEYTAGVTVAGARHQAVAECADGDDVGETDARTQGQQSELAESSGRDHRKNTVGTSNSGRG